MVMVADFDDGRHSAVDFLDASPGRAIMKQQYIVRRGVGGAADGARIVNATVAHLQAAVGDGADGAPDGSALGPLAVGHYYGGLVDALDALHVGDGGDGVATAAAAGSTAVAGGRLPPRPKAFEFHFDTPGYLARHRLTAAALSASQWCVPAWRPPPAPAVVLRLGEPPGGGSASTLTSDNTVDENMSPFYQWAGLPSPPGSAVGMDECDGLSSGPEGRLAPPPAWPLAVGLDAARSPFTLAAALPPDVGPSPRLWPLAPAAAAAVAAAAPPPRPPSQGVPGPAAPAAAGGAPRAAAGGSPAAAADGAPKRRRRLPPAHPSDPVRYARMLRNRESARRCNERRKRARAAAKAAASVALPPGDGAG